MILHVADYIQTAFSIEDAEIIDKVIEKHLKSKEEIILDFENVTFFTTLFFNNAITKYVLELTPEIYEKTFILRGLSEVGRTTYSHSHENAINFFNLTVAQRNTQEEIVQEME